MTASREGSFSASWQKNMLDIIKHGMYIDRTTGEDKNMTMADPWLHRELPKSKTQRICEMAEKIGLKCREKNIAYGDAVATSVEALKLLYPTGVPVKAYGDMLLLVRIWDKLQRIATDKDALGESPFEDIGGYGVLGAVKDGER